MAGPDADRDLLDSAARAAGDILARFYHEGAEVWEKSRNNPVTEADIAAETALRDTLLAARPGYGWLSEETEDDGSRLEKTRVFVVDPMDGTRAFIRRRPHFTVSLAVVEAGLPIAAAVYNPLTDEMFSAARGSGAWKNGKQTQVTGHARIAGARLLGDTDYFRKSLADSASIERRNSIAYRLALVASGEYDGAVSPRPKSDWDLAAGQLLVEEAGGILTNTDGDSYSYGLQSVRKSPPLAAGPHLHALLRERLAH
ncbi:inositol monophosphatase family protein [Hyphobacterium marinum]|uniref:3'(2'),5'-bisphosphate nucleotidase CysQ n=1 Tax=Hyphobacterium marinum TaxID=3116574 RepID=A0ABU7LXQ7_9PROT|nr:3'(2'),5'-bisphosphate nucleotidase CysQ [Hyphobacterium sp. Y6023]MEE2565975.1 3'(2'),5'-bisphosphate nucleotidase CysQ [Hyphobacterium sp. Y6023]